MNDTERDLLRAACERPYDDLPRLVYADYLEERGEPELAAFVRDQIARPKTCLVFVITGPKFGWYAAPMGTPKYPPDSVRDHFLAQLRSSGLPHDSRVEIRRGFVDAVTVSMGALRGGECDACGGDGVERWRVNDGTEEGIEQEDLCRHCTYGRLPGLVRALSAFPLTTVRVTGVEPDAVGEEFCWLQERPDVLSRAIVPKEIFAMLKGGRHEDAGQDWLERFGYLDEWIVYPTPELAHAACDHAALNYVRACAEPPLGALVCRENNKGD